MFLKINSISNDLLVELNKKTFTAKVFLSNTIKGNLFIPCSIILENKRYEIIDFLGSLADSEIKYLQFNDNSMIRSIPTDFFSSSTIQSLCLPSRIKDLKLDWCSKTPNLNTITVSSKNKYLKAYNNQILVGKSSLQCKKYDILYFVSRKIESIHLSSDIKKINAYSFEDCKKIKYIRISKKSQLKIIDIFAFSNSTIQSIFIPDNVSIINDYAFYQCKNLLLVEISKKSKLFSIGASAFEESSISSIFIPSQVDEIKKNTFYLCDNLNSVIFSKESKCKWIRSYSFSHSAIKSIKIPKHVKSICEYAFFKCTKMKSIQFEDNSELSSIEPFSFAYSSIQNITIPDTLKAIDKFSFDHCKDLKNITITQKSNLNYIGEDVLSNSGIEEIYIPNNIEITASWCEFAPNLKKFKTSLSNVNFINIGNRIILGRSSFEYDYAGLLFISYELEKVFIPSSILYYYNLFSNKKSRNKSIEMIEIKDPEIDTFTFKLIYIWLDIPKKYHLMIDYIKNDIMKNVYSKFTFKYFKFGEIQKPAYHQIDEHYDENIIYNLFIYLVNFRLIVYHIKNFTELEENQCQIGNSPNLNSDTKCCIFCVEDECLIVENIDINMIEQLINNLKKYEVSLIDVSKISEAKEEIKNFCNKFTKEINENYFVEYTVDSIVGYLIRRYYYPSSYFIDRSFFNFNQQSNRKDQDIKKKIRDYFYQKEKITDFYQEDFLQIIINEINELNDENDNKNNSNTIFKENDFIILRTIYSNNSANYYLVIHIYSLYIFMMKKYHDPIKKTKSNEREQDFCKYSHRCLTPFYGFLTKNDKIIGLIYEFMSNGDLLSYIENNDQIDDTFTRLTISRIYQGIFFLHKKKLIHRDLKPSNILIDHDNLAYIFDFETVRSINPIDGEFTNDIGSIIYTSPEQDQGANISYPTDIYSFGLIVYYLFEKNNMWHIFENKSNKIKPMNKGSPEIQNLYKKCVQENPEKRLKNDEIQSLIKEEFNTFLFCEYFTNKTLKVKLSGLLDFIFENIIIQMNNKSTLYCYNQIHQFQEIFYFSIIHNNSNFFYSYGKLHIYGGFIKKNIIKGIEYLNKAGELKNSLAFAHLGFLYNFGFSVKKDYLIALEYYRKSAKLGNTLAYIFIGYLYFYGYGVKQDYQKAKEYFIKSAKSYSSYGYNSLGFLYEKGFGVEQNLEQAKNNYEKSQNFSNSDALNYIGYHYENGLGVQQDYIKARKYYIKSAELNNSNAINYLGNYYENGYGVEKNYTKAKEYYEKSAKLNNSYALYNLGNLYENGYGVMQNYTKAKEYYEKSAKYNNLNSFFKLGNLYEKGFGVKQNFLNAKEYYEKLTKSDNFDDLFNSGFFYNEKFELKEDYIQAKEYYIKISWNNISNAHYCLGRLYYYGYGVEKNYIQAKKYFENSLKFGNFDSLYYLGSIYEKGLGIKRDYTKAKEFYEKSSKFDNSYALNSFGNLYANGLGVERDLTKAKEFYEKSSKFNNSYALNNLGNLYFNGLGVERDYIKAKEFYEKSSKFNNSYALNNLGYFYEKYLNDDKKFIIAKQYYKRSSNLNNLYAFFNLGRFYENGLGGKQDYLKAKAYYEKSSYFNNSYAFYHLGHLYEEGLGVKKSKFQAIKYYIIASQLGNCYAHFHIGHLYYFENDFEKSIEYLNKSIKIKNKIEITYDTFYDTISCNYIQNNYRYISYNTLGLIYITVKNDINYAEAYFKESAFAEYPFGQNNFGLLSQFYLNNIGNAEYMYTRSAKHNFSLAEYNIGHLYEKLNKKDESIKYYKLASEHEDIPLTYRGTNYNDKKLEISKIFIILLTNLKLVEYYFSQKEYDESKKYFTKLFNKIIFINQNLTYQFKLRINIGKKPHDEYLSDIFLYLKRFILNFPLFNLINQKNLNLDQFSDIFQSKDSHFNVKSNEKRENLTGYKSEFVNNYTKLTNKTNTNEKNNNFNDQKIIKFKEVTNLKSDTLFKQNGKIISEKKLNLTENEMIFEDPSILFDFLINKLFINSQSKLSTIFLNEIKDIIKIMSDILYTKPFPILFGCISFEKPFIDLHKEINQDFYDGFET